jgi:hypothetical protein
MKKSGPAGCGLMILGIIGLFSFAIPMGFSFDTSAVQATQLYSSATMWTTLLVAVGIGLLLLTVEEVRGEIEKQLAPEEPPSKTWEYCDLMEGRVYDGQTNEQRQVSRLLHHTRTGTKEQPVSNRQDALSKLSQDGWELISAYTIPHSATVSETHWVFKRLATTQAPTSKQAKSSRKGKG